MAKWAHSDVLDGGLNAIKNSATKMYLIKVYSAADSYATVLSNALNAGVSMAPEDYTLADSGLDRRLTVASGKTGTATAGSGASPDLHIALTDDSARVLWVTDETTNQVITSGNVLTFPSITYTNVQPV